MKDLQLYRAELYRLTVIQLDIWLWRGLDCDAPQVSATASAKERRIQRVKRQRSACGLHYVGVGRHHVPVSMGIEHILDI
jgi:hypothetical protein